MTPSNTKKEKGEELAPVEAADVPATQDELEAQLVAQNAAEIVPSDLQVPLLKIGQPLTDEVQSGDAQAGNFINSLTREGLGTEIDFLVAGYAKGRFFGGDDERRARKAYGVPNVPWREDPHYGEPFTSHPDAEEQYAERVNAGEIEWGKGPPISTTYDFTGYILSDDPEVRAVPVCLSLMRTNAKAARKWATLLQVVLHNKYWDRVFHLSTERTQNERGQAYYTLNIKKGRKTTQEEKAKALELALILRKREVSFVGDENTEGAGTSEPQAAGGMAV